MSNKVTKRLTKKDILTIPNVLSFLRILLVPLILYLYCILKNPFATAGVILFSAFTDIVDGRIARRFHMISDFGKFIDPVADKLTQVAMIVCLILCFISALRWQLCALLALFVVKELLMFVVGAVVLKKTDTVNSSKWYGKVATVVLYIVMLALMVFPKKIPEWGANVLLFTCAGVMLYALVRYLMFYAEILKENKANTKKQTVQEQSSRQSAL